MLTHDQTKLLLSQARSNKRAPFTMKSLFEATGIPCDKGAMISMGYRLRENGYEKTDTNKAMVWQYTYNQLLLDLSPETKKEELIEILGIADVEARRRLLEALLDSMIQ